MALLVVGYVVNVLGDIRIDSPQPFSVDTIATSFRSFVVPNSAQLVVLGVKVSLEGFSRSQELQDGSIACS
jgi:hypothetical protein